MRATEQNATTPSAKTGFSAGLGALLTCPGSGALSLAFSLLQAHLAVVAIIAFVATLSLGLSRAVASQPHALIGSFGSSGSAAGQFELTAESGLAVDQSTGNVYLADTGNHRVDEFSGSGAFIRAFGWGVATGAAAPQTCTTTCQAGLPGPEPGQFEQPTFITVDNTPGGAGGLYVVDRGSVTNERQTITVNATGGSYTLSYTSLIRGTTTSGSKLVTGVIGRVSDAGDPISGPGIPPGTTMVPGLNQTLELSAPATASAKDLVLATMGTTASIIASATPEELQSALENLNALQSGVCVSGKAGGPYTVEFCGVLAETNVPQMTCDGSSLTPSGATCTVVTAVDGKNTARVQKFDSASKLMTGWGGTPAPGEVDGTTCAVANRCGFNPHFGELYGVAVKPNGNFLALNSRNFKLHFLEWTQSSGEYIQSVATTDGEPIGIAVDPAGRLYLGRGSSHPPFEVIQTSYCQPGDPSGFCPEGPAYQENFPLSESAPATGVAVDPITEDVYVAQFNPNPPAHTHSDVAAYDHEDNLPERPFGGNGDITEAGGIAVSGSTSDVYVADRGAGRVEIFAPGGNRDALTVTRAGTALGSVSSVPAGIACPYTCSTSFPVGEEVTLTATAPEHASFVGWSGGGCAGTGVCQLALTAAASVTAIFAQDRPTLTTDLTSAVTRHTATLTGTVDPEGDASSCRFEYGLASAYGAEAPCASYPGSGVGPVAVSAQLWELAASATYHYRLVAANTGGPTYGPDMTFMTLAEGCASHTTLCPPLPVATSVANEGLVFSKRPTTKTLTNVQKLAQALKVCRKQKKRSVRVNCEKQARKKYAPAKEKIKKSTRRRKRG